MDNGIILRAENIKKHFTGTYALKGVSVELKRGEIHALVGENGAGKSTLMNIISGVFPCDEGSIYLDSTQVHFRNPNDAQISGIGFVHQELALCQDLSVGNNIFIGHLPTNKGLVDNDQLYQHSRRILDQFGESGKSINPAALVSTLSVAQQQMVEIAKALSSDCKVLIFDEPTRGVDVGAKAEIYKLMCQQAQQGKAVVMISSDMPELIGICDRIYVMREGTISGELDRKDFSQEAILGFAVS